MIVTEGLTKHYGAVHALSDLTTEVRKGEVFGLLGPNGSGKTTTLRILLGLSLATDGEVRLLGHRVPDQLPRVIGGVGALVEAPRLFPQWSGRFNLQVLARYTGVSTARVEECLDIVGMREDAEVPFRQCSLGMKQRLGIAAGLLKNPRLLILDEPGNGLDPAGIREMRELIQQLGRDGRTTVLVSSHQLAEVQLMCDRVSVVSRGRLVAEGEVGALLNGTGTPDFVVRTGGGARRTYEVLVVAGVDCTQTPEGALVRGEADPSRISELLARHGEYVSALVPQLSTLESAFLEWTAEPVPVGAEA